MRTTTVLLLGLLPLFVPLGVSAATLPSSARPVLRHIDLDRKAVALTVDEDFAHISSTLGALQEAGAHATFFAYAKDVTAHPDASRRILGAGSEIGSMGAERTDWRGASPVVIERQLARSDALMKDVTGENGVNFFRPATPYPARLPSLVRARGQLFTLWRWDLDTLSDQAIARLGHTVSPGDVLRLTDTASSAPRLAKVLDVLKSAGFRVESLRDLVLDTPPHLSSCGVMVASPGEPRVASFLQRGGRIGDRLARRLYGTKPGVRLEGLPAGRLLPGEVRRLVHTFALRMNRPPVSVDVLPDGRVLDGVAGFRIEKATTVSRLMSAKPHTEVRAARRLLPPPFTKNDIDRLTLELGRFHTWTYGSSGRIHNIAHGADMLDYLLLLPGRPFSFFATLGPAQDETGGWKRAPIYAYGGSIQGYGGGLCQVSTTLYQAAKRSGMEILERHPHGRPVPYVPHGMDATVAYPHFNLRFVNRRKTPVLLRMEVRGGRLEAWMLGDPKDGPAPAPVRSRTGT